MKSPGMAARLMSAFIYALAKSDADGKKLSDMGIPDVSCVGNMKHAAPPLRYSPDDLEELASAVGPRKVWVASVTHSGEDELILRAHEIVRAHFSGALLIISPRHVERGAAIGALADGMGFRSALASKREAIGAATDVYISDVFGRLGLFYALSDIVFIGGSLLRHLHGHNPMEAARLGAAVLSGPNVDSFLETYEILGRENAAIIVDDEEALGSWTVRLMSSPELLSGFRGRAAETAEREAAVLGRAKEKLQPILDGILSGKD
jgi:3-deoxy-D-manno-octulosonic-acid transferase